MFNIEENKRLLGLAAAQALSEKFDSAIAESSESGECTQEHEIKMRCILSGEKIRRTHSTTYGEPHARLPWKRIIAIIAAAALLLTACAAAVFHEEIAGFIAEIREGGDSLTSAEQGDTNKIETVYYMSYVPEGYVLRDECAFDWLIIHTYENAEGDLISLRQFALGAFVAGFDTNDADKSALFLDDIEICSYTNEDGAHFVWNNFGYSFRLSLANCDTEELEAIFRGIKEK